MAELTAELARLLRSSSALVPALLVPGLVNLLTYPLLTRTLSADDVGTFALVAGIVSFAPIAASFWLESAIVRYAYVGGPGIDPRDVQRGRTMSLTAAACITLVAALVVTRGALAMSIAAALMAMIVVRFTIALAPVRAAGRFARYSVLMSTRSVLGLPLALAGAVALGPIGAIIGQNMAQIGLSRSLVDVEVSGGPTAIRLRAAFRYGAPVALMNVAATALSIADRYIIELSHALSDVAIYTAAYVMLEQLFRLLPAVASTALAPSVYRWWATGRRRRAVSMIMGGLGVVVALEAALLAVVLIGGDFWTSLLSPAYGAATRIAGPLGLGLVLHAGNQFIALLYTAQERVRILAINFGIAAAANVALNLLIVPSYGIIGAAWVTCLTYGLLLCANVTGQLLIRFRPVGPARA